MKSTSQSSTPKNLAAKLRSNSTGQEYSFIFEDAKYSITGSNPIELFHSLAELDRYLEKNPELVEMPDAGFAGYMSYEGNCEFALYESIHKNNTKNSSPTSVIAKNEAIQKEPFPGLEYPNPDRYIQSIKKCQEYIKEGDIYQANLSCRFSAHSSRLTGLDIYQKLKSLNPAPYMGYMNFKNYEIISSSPECFLSISPLSVEPRALSQDWSISSSPIKGTAKLSDLNQLLKSEKERAEHIMILDLIRNDLGKICVPGSIEIPEILASHKFTNLYHLVSTVRGKLQLQGLPNFDKIFQACFPGGSITGAPKIRAMEIIKELETSPRGPYTGTMGYFRFRDGGKFNILIRTIVRNNMNNETSFHVGAGITIASDPKQELQECYLKAEKLIEVLNND